MAQIGLDIRPLLAKLTTLEQKQVPWAQVVAVNATAPKVVEAIKRRLPVVFDRPTRFTQNAFHVSPRATKAKPEAVIGEKPTQARKHYLKVQTEGGVRGQTGLEKALANRASVQGPLRSIIPATGSAFEAAKLDSFGNWSTGQRNQVMSALGVQRDQAANTTAASTKRKKSRATFFIPKQGLAPGVYTRKKAGDIPVRVLKFSDKAPSYSPRFDFISTVLPAYRDEIGPAFEKALAEAIKSAR